MKIFKKNIQIAIDGPVGSGKSVGARLLAKKLGIFYLNTGATFRAVAYLAVKKGLNFQDEQLITLINKTKIDIKMERSGSCRLIIAGQDVTKKLFSKQMDYGSSAVAVRPKIRDILTQKWRETAEDKAIVMEGRDINKVLPKADLKIFMTASLKIRAQRIWKKYGTKGELKKVEKQIKIRDYQDSHRKINPLKYTRDYWLLDTSSLTMEEEINHIIKKLKSMGLVA